MSVLDYVDILYRHDTHQKEESVAGERDVYPAVTVSHDSTIDKQKKIDGWSHYSISFTWQLQCDHKYNKPRLVTHHKYPVKIKI